MTVAPANIATLEEPAESRRGFRVSPLQWAVLFVGSFALYIFSAMPNVQWQDSGEFALRVIRGELLDEAGLCRVHPLHFWLCTLAVKILPFTLPLACATISALGGAISIANIYGIVKQMTGKNAAAWLAAMGLMVAHSFWRFSCFIEVYSLCAAMLTAETWCLVKWDQTRKPSWLIAMFFFNGLGLADHDLAMLSLPAIGIVFLIALARRQANLKTAFLGLAAWLAGSGMYLVLIIQDAHQSGWHHAFISATVGDFGGLVEGKSLVWFYTATTIAFTLLSFPNLMLPAALLGIFRGRRAGVTPISFYAILGSLFMHALFVLRYNVIDQYTFALSGYVLLAICSGIGFAVVQSTWSPALRKKTLALATSLLVFTPMTYIVTAVITRHFHALGHYARNKPYRDDYRYLFLPWGRGENSAAEMSTRAVALAGEHGLIMEPDGMGFWPIAYELYLQKHDGVTLVMGADDATVSARVAAHQPVVFVPFSVVEGPWKVAAGQWQRVGDLFVLQPYATTQPATMQKAP